MGAKMWPNDEQELTMNANHVQINQIYAEYVMSTYPS